VNPRHRGLMNLRETALALFRAGTERVLPGRVIPENLSGLDLGERVRLISVGKAGASSAQVAAEILGKRLARGLVVSPEDCEIPGLETIKSSHPLPDEASLRAGERALEIARSAGKDETLLVLLSGGASSLMDAPVGGIGLEELRKLYELMLRSGLDIHEINTVRRHVSRVKGGGLASSSGAGRLVALIVSDVIGNTLEDIGSGPTAPDPSLKADALTILKRSGIWHEMSNAFREAAWDAPETPKPDDPCFTRVRNLIVADNRAALLGVKDRATEMGYDATVVTDALRGEAREVGFTMGGILAGIAGGSSDLSGRRACLIFGGETTVRVRGKGTGGRNQELALACALAIKGLGGVAIVAFSTDGVDGPTPATGAFADGETCERAGEKGLDPQGFLEENDSYSFFRRVGGLVETGPTGTNVADCVVLLLEGT
jgi:glycerate 2-kinase